ncbi:MAG: RepB family plasmid replication initiator protein [Pantoea sp.]|uniref:RepB family plasmid replication initiator protein n=1 Tax=unclassified Pantoea TaxID=2630326 RepID=UPI0003AC6F92|nr:RepB family plasmid replication initiator protein [Pantoea sp. AS-PWVM4]ERK05831.1 RepFIB replication protein A [Pantoea sp. AS-PWVM4]
MAKKVNDLDSMTEEVNKKTGEVVHLNPSATATVQPVALMRLGLFVPNTDHAKAKSSVNTVKSTVDATEDLYHLEVVKREGYKDISIRSERLDMATDFRVWLGIIRSIYDNGTFAGKLKLPFTKFLQNCGFDSKRSNKDMKKRIDDSLMRLRGVTIQFRNDTGSLTTGLVNSAHYNMAKNEVEIEGDHRLADLYQMDYKVYLRLKAIDHLPRKESAQALYTFIESLPRNPAPVSMKRLRERLRLKSRIAYQNHIVRKALEELKEINYLEYTETKRGRSVYFNITKRNPNLIPDKSLKLDRSTEDEPQVVDEAMIAKISKLKDSGFSEEEIAKILISLDSR